MNEKQKHPDLKHFFHQGKLTSYIRTLCDALEDCLENHNDTHLETLLSGVYQNSELLDFFEHYSAFVRTADLYKRVLGIKKKLFSRGKITKEIKAGTTVLFESLESYLSPSSPVSFENDELKYMVLPAVLRFEGSDEDEITAVLNYIFYEPVAVPDDRWLAGQFYSFKNQPQAVEYFEVLVDEIKANLFFQERRGLRTRIDLPEMRWPHYGIFFDQKVLDRSYGGALMVLMLLGFIETLCSPKGHGFGGYLPSTMIQGNIEDGGTVKPGDHIFIKTDAFLNEYGCEDVRLILAEGSQEALQLKYRQGKYLIGNHAIEKNKVIFVKNTGELFAAAFPGWKDLVSAVWRKLPESYQRNLYIGLADGWTPGKIEREFLTKAVPSPTLLNYSQAKKGLKISFHYSGEYDGSFDLRFGFEESAFFMDPGSGAINEVIIIAVDGSYFAESLWWGEKNKGKDSKIAQAVFEIVRNLARKGRSFYVHFLSCPEPEILNVVRFPGSAELNAYMLKRRKELDLPMRGNFIFPLVHYWSSRSPAARKRILVISNGPVYDCRDFDFDEIFRENLWFCFEGANKTYLPAAQVTCLDDIGKDVRERLRTPSRKITRLKLLFENWLPYEWNIPGMVLKSNERDESAGIFEYEPDLGTAPVILKGMFLANVPCKNIDYEIDIKEEAGSCTISGCLPANEIPMPGYHSDVVSGRLLDDEWEIWENFINGCNSGDYICPVCEKKHQPRLTCKSAGESMLQIIFPSLRYFRGFVILESHKKEWFIAKTGIRLEDNYFFKMNGFFYVFSPSRSSQPRQVKQGNVSIGNRKFYILEI